MVPIVIFHDNPIVIFHDDPNYTYVRVPVALEEVITDLRTMASNPKLLQKIVKLVESHTV
jgi:hypothetical protein